MADEIFKGWQSYERDVVPASAPSIQREECRRAFYAGAWEAFQRVMDAVSPDNERECERQLVALETEIRRILDDLKV